MGVNGGINLEPKKVSPKEMIEMLERERLETLNDIRTSMKCKETNEEDLKKEIKLIETYDRAIEIIRKKMQWFIN